MWQCADDEILTQGRNTEFFDDTLLGLMHYQSHKNRWIKKCYYQYYWCYSSSPQCENVV